MPRANIVTWAEAAVSMMDAADGGQEDYRDMIDLAKFIDADGDLRDKLLEESVDVDEKVATIKSCMDTYNPRLSPIISAILVAGEFRHFLAIAEEAFKRKSEKMGAYMANVWTAYPLTQDQLQGLITTLEKKLDQPVTVHVSVDPKLIGGIAVDVNEEYLDGTVKRRVDSMRQLLAESQ